MTEQNETNAGEVLAEIAQHALNGIIDREELPKDRSTVINCGVFVLLALFDEFVTPGSRVGNELYALAKRLQDKDDPLVAAMNVSTRAQVWSTVNLLVQRRRHVLKEDPSSPGDA